MHARERSWLPLQPLLVQMAYRQAWRQYAQQITAITAAVKRTAT
jgi:hypothetical protein